MDELVARVRKGLALSAAPVARVEATAEKAAGLARSLV
jgi:hypothetical protein